MMTTENRGFTLIEIVMMLVLLGILAAVAVPKYFDLQEEAMQKAAMQAVAEAQARMNAVFSEKLLSGETCANAVAAAGVLTDLDDGADKDSARFGDFVLTPVKITADTEMTVKLVDGEGLRELSFASQPKLTVAQCSDEEKSIVGNDVAQKVYNFIDENEDLKSAIKGNNNDGIISSYMGNELTQKIEAALKEAGYDLNGLVWSVEVKKNNFRVAVTNVPLDKAAEAAKSGKRVETSVFDESGVSRTVWVKMSSEDGIGFINPSQAAKSDKYSVEKDDKFTW